MNFTRRCVLVHLSYMFSKVRVSFHKFSQIYNTRSIQITMLLSLFGFDCTSFVLPKVEAQREDMRLQILVSIPQVEPQREESQILCSQSVAPNGCSSFPSRMLISQPSKGVSLCIPPPCVADSKIFKFTGLCQGPPTRRCSSLGAWVCESCSHYFFFWGPTVIILRLILYHFLQLWMLHMFFAELPPFENPILLTPQPCVIWQYLIYLAS